MRAEAQDHIDTINAALALVRRFLDWDRALRRLDEINAKVEDPTLWDNPRAAQEVMRARRRPDEAVTAMRASEKDRSEERREGKECVRTCRYRTSSKHSKKTINQNLT